MSIDHSPSANGGLPGPEAAAGAHQQPGANSSTHRIPRAWRIVLQVTALETIAALNPRFGRLSEGVWVPNYSEIARQGGVSKQHLSSVVAGHEGAGEAVHAALLGVAATYGLEPDRAWGKLFKLVQCDQGSDSVHERRRERRPRVAKVEPTRHGSEPDGHAELATVRARMRTWAWEKGLPVGQRGPIPAAIVERYLEQHPEDRRALISGPQVELGARA